MRIIRSIIAVSLLSTPIVLRAQSYPSSTQTKQDTTPAKPVAHAVPPLDFSGIIFANYQYRGDAGPSKAQNKFDVERAYLTFRIPAGAKTSVRITTDLFQQTTSGNDNFYRGWVLRAKYAYLQYNYLNGPNWKALARIGLLHTVFVDWDEQFWPRWLSLTPTERAGYFSSADGGIATSVTLPQKFGELYATITNGPGYTSREVDRFKDYAARLTITPWGTNQSKILKTVALSGWVYRGATASKFVTASPGQIGAIGEGLDRNRWGLHAGINDPRLITGLQYASRTEEGETGLNTLASPRAVTDSTGHLVAGYAVVYPFAFTTNTALAPLGFVGRWDRVTTNTNTDWKYNVVIAGVIWDLSKRASMSLDYQEQTNVEGQPISASKIYFAHFVARF